MSKKEYEQSHLYKIRHSAAHVMAQAVLEMFPKGKVAIGPPIEDGFYYDFDLPRALTTDDLKAIEKRMRNIIKKRHTFARRELSAEEAKEIFADQPYKIELIEGLETGGVDEYGEALPAGETPVISIYKHDTFVDLCKGPHVENLGKINPKAIKLLNVAGAYWRGDENRQQLQRIYGTAWEKPQELKDYLARLEEAKKRDHRKLGKELGLFSIDAENLGGGLVLWQPKGGLIRRDFPLRYAEWGTVYRYERSGVLHGLLRVRGFTQDDAHHFCREDQMPEEIDFVLKFCLHILRSFGFENFHAYLSTQPPEKSVGEAAQWRAAEKALEEALQRANIPYDVDEGGGAFYGPKIDLKISDAIGREWQLSTIQFDFNLPERFDMSYIGSDGKEHRPYMIHRALMGSMERFFGVLIEHFAGAFPVWLMPTQAMLIPIADRHVKYAEKVAAQLKTAGLRVEIDDSNDRMGNKIRKAQKQKIPYMLVVGDKEAEENTVAIRLRSGENLGPKPLDEFAAMALEAVEEKRSV
ncbi:MAG: threonine--tRNA ligase [Anaerolineaceae bacterium 4572_5.2]|nr:MAG: threonine--tRNA ligase [Anaerolineaceae bacterium 4572_5.2]